MVFDLHLFYDLDLHSVENITMTYNFGSKINYLIISPHFYCFQKIKPVNKNRLLNIGQGHTNNAYTCNYNKSLNEAFSDLLCNKQLTQP